MKVNYKSKIFDTKKKYEYSNKFYHDGKEVEEKFIFRLELKTYGDGECYGTMEHYGYVFIIDKIIKKHYNYRVGDVHGTLADLYHRVKEVK